MLSQRNPWLRAFVILPRRRIWYFRPRSFERDALLCDAYKARWQDNWRDTVLICSLSLSKCTVDSPSQLSPVSSSKSRGNIWQERCFFPRIWNSGVTSCPKGSAATTRSAVCYEDPAARPLANWPSLLSIPGNSRKSLAKLGPFDVPFSLVSKHGPVANAHFTGCFLDASLHVILSWNDHSQVATQDTFQLGYLDDREGPGKHLVPRLSAIGRIEKASPLLCPKSHLPPSCYAYRQVELSLIVSISRSRSLVLHIPTVRSCLGGSWCLGKGE